MKKFIVVFAVVLLLSGCGAVQAEKKDPIKSVSNGDEKVIVQAETQKSIKAVSTGLSDMIIVTEPVSGDSASCPLHVSGGARGYWYFEATFPYDLVDGSGNLITTGSTSANGEWMTEDFVPFAFDIFYTTAEQSGTLILKRSNPSGLPQNDMQLEIPIQLAPCAQKAAPAIEKSLE